MSEQRALLIERKDDIVTLSFNLPERRNVWTPEIRDAMIEALSELSGDRSCRAIVLTGTGGNFTVGGDIRSFTQNTIMTARQRLERGASVLVKLLVAGPKPVVAAVEGFCYGAGVSLAACCDYVVAAPDTKFSCAYVRMGLIPDLGGLWALPRRVGLGRAKRLTVLAKPFDGVEAERIGLADELAPSGSVLQAANRVAREFAAMPPIAQAMLKAAYAEGLDDALRTEVDYLPVLMSSADHAEAKTAFFEKREPRFTGE
jgi:enoyl-CoA hydratase/carnithine racemase